MNTKYHKIHPDPNQIEIETDKLIPFGNFSFDLFKGRRLEEMVYNVRCLNKVCQAIYVRPAKDGKYEVIDGYYRTIAAKKLGFKTVPAIVFEELTDEDVKSCISVFNPIGLQLHYGVDIYNPRYKEEDTYKKIEQLRFKPENYYSISIDVYIERYLLNDADVCKIYKSIYDMGNPRELSSEECEYYALAKAIHKEQKPNSEDDDEVSQWKKSKDYGEQRAAEIAEDSYIDDINIIARRFNRKDYGYIDRLKKWFDYDLDSFDYSILKNRQQKIRIIYLIYKMEHYVFPNTNVIELLNKPSMENVDNFSLGRQTSNGEIIRYIKNAVEKEMTLVKDPIDSPYITHPLTPMENVKRAIDAVAKAWSRRLEYYIINMELLALQGYDFDDDINLLKSVMSSPIYCEKNTLYDESTTTPLEIFYLKLLQHEFLGQVKDSLYIFDKQTGAEYNIPPEYIMEMRAYEHKSIDMDDIDNLLNKFFESKNVEKIAKYVYLKPKTTTEERRKIRNSIDKVRKLIDFCFIYELSNDAASSITELFIISCLQAIILDEEEFDYAFYGYEGKKGKRKAKKSLQAMLKNDKNNYDAPKVFWVRKVVDRSFANVGNYYYRESLREIEKIIFGILDRILSCSTESEMISMNCAYDGKFTEYKS